MKYVYTATLLPGDGQYYVKFPDLPGCVTVGSDLSDAIEMAEDALNLYLTGAEDDGDPIPPATPPNQIRPVPPAFTTLIRADTDLYRRLYPFVMDRPDDGESAATGT